MSDIQWNIRHILKDGRVLKPGEKLPITKESLEVFREVGEIAVGAMERHRKQVTEVDTSCTYCLTGR